MELISPIAISVWSLNRESQYFNWKSMPMTGECCLKAGKRMEKGFYLRVCVIFFFYHRDAENTKGFHRDFDGPEVVQSFYSHGFFNPGINGNR